MELGDGDSSGCGFESRLEERPAVYLVYEAANGGPFLATNLDSFFLPLECKTGVATVSSHAVRRHRSRASGLNRKEQNDSIGRGTGYTVPAASDRS